MFAAINSLQAQFIWNSGDILTAIGVTTIGSSGTLSIATTANHDFNTHTVLNEGTVNWTDGALRSGNGGTFTNAAGALFNDLNTATNHIQNIFGGSFSFTNAGTYTKDGAGTTIFSVPFHNSGAVNVAAGTFKLEGGGATTAAGVINTSAGATTIFNASYTVDNAASLTGAGTYALTAGTLDLTGTASVSPFNQTGGILAGTHTFADVDFNWTGGTWSTAGTTTFDDQSTLNLTGATSKDFNFRTVINEGTVNWSGGALRSGTGGTFTNAAGALFNDLNTATNHIQNVFGGSFSFTNAGTYTKDGAGTVTAFQVPFINAGLLEISLGTISVSSPLTLQPGSLLSFGLAGPNAGLDHGELSMSGALVLDGMLQYYITAGFINSTVPTDTFTLISTGGLTGTFSNISSGGRLPSFDGLGSFAVHYGAGSSFGINNVVLTDFIPVPEPSTWALLITGLGVIVISLRRRRS